jgi:hypothetical protein
MASSRIATTRWRDIQALGRGGRNATESWAALTSLLSQRRSPAHAALFAEPVANPVRQETDWYSALDGTARPLSSIDPARREKVQVEFDHLVAEIRALADEMRGARGEGDRNLGEMLALALEVPGLDNILVVEDGPKLTPVLVGWGHARTSAAAERVSLSGRIRPPPRPMTILPPPVPLTATQPPRNLRGLLIALAGALLVPVLALLLLLVDPLHWFDLAVPQCRLDADNIALLSDLRGDEAREQGLRAQLAELSGNGARQRMQCPPVADNTPPQPPPIRPTPTPSNDVQRADQRNAQRGKLQIILAWDDLNDLDLHVVCPGGSSEINFQHRNTCGGTLDVDANADDAHSTRSPVENVFFNNPAAGTYTVVVDPFAMRVGPQSAFRVTIRREGQPDQVVTGVAHTNQRNQRVIDIPVPAR